MSELVEMPALLSDAEYQKMNPEEKESYIKGVLSKILIKNPYGLTISQLKQNLPFEKRVMEKHLEIMKYTNEIYSITVGKSILYIPNHKAMHEATSESVKLGDYEYQVYILKNRLGHFAVIQQRNLRKDSQDIVGSLQLPLEHYDDLIDYLRKTKNDMERRGV